MFAIRGLVLGTVRQVFGFLGVLAGLWAAGWVSQWVGAHWQFARPAVVFWVMRWLVAGLAGLAVASLCDWCGGLLGKAAQKSPLGWLDRLGGLAFGAMLAVVLATFALVLTASASWSPQLRLWTARSRSAPVLLGAGARISQAAAPALPRGLWLRDRFLEAQRRVEHHTRRS